MLAPVTAPAEAVVHESPFDPSIPVIRTGSPEFVALFHTMNKRAA